MITYIVFSLFTGKQTSEVKVVKNSQPSCKSTSDSSQKPAAVSSFSKTVSSDVCNSVGTLRSISSSPSLDYTDAPAGSRDSQVDGLPSEGQKSAEQEPPVEPPVDNIPPSPFTLRASNCKTYRRPNRKTSSESAENNSSSSSKPPDTASAEVKPNSVFAASASNTSANANTAAKPAAAAGRGRGRVRDYTVLHPSCLSVCNVTIQDSMERSMDELVTPAAPSDLGEAGQMKKKSDVPPPKPTR